MNNEEQVKIKQVIIAYEDGSFKGYNRNAWYKIMQEKMKEMECNLCNYNQPNFTYYNLDMRVCVECALSNTYEDTINLLDNLLEGVKDA
tara:strand:+ start:56 stop:322 length:267 start_codon:yes stop_codon:yes gene_type:complete